MAIPLYFYINFLSILIWLYFRKRFIEKGLFRLFDYLLFMFVAELIAWVYSYTYHKSNHWIYNIITIAQVILILRLYYSKVEDKKELYVLKRSPFFFASLYVINLLTSNNIKQFDSLTFILGALCVIYFSITYLKRQVFSDDVSPLSRNIFFWISIGNLIFWVGSLFYLGLLNYIVEKELDVFGNLINYFVYTFSAIQYILFIKAILCNLSTEQT